MKTFSIKEAFNRSWELFKTHKKVLILAALISILINIAVNSGTDSWSLWSSVFNIVCYVISLWIMIGFIKITLKIVDGGSPTIHELFAYKDLIWKYFLITIVYGLIVAFGLILIIPGIYFAMKYIFAPLLVVDKGRSVREALDESARMTEGLKWHIFQLFLLCVLLIILGFVALGVGLLVAIPVVHLMYVHVYRKLS